MGWLGIRRAAGSMLALCACSVLAVAPASAHGENDARPIARHATVGIYEVSIWQVIGDHGAVSSAHVLVLFGDNAPGSRDSVLVTVEAPRRADLDATPSATLEGAWQTAGAAEFGDVIRVGVVTADGESWSQPYTVPLPPGAALPMGLIVAVALVISTVVVIWLLRRARRAWTSPGTRTLEKY